MKNLITKPPHVIVFKHLLLKYSFIIPFLLVSCISSAMDENLGIECEHCRYGSVVRINQCTAVYMGNRLLITAAHCTDSITEGVSQALFGEDEDNPEYSFTIESCENHPDGTATTNVWGDDSWHGPDIAYCILEDSVIQDLPAPFVIPPMIPHGCERDWLAERTYNSKNNTLVTAVGMGCAIPSTGGYCYAGIKRYTGQQLTKQTYSLGSNTKLELTRKNIWGDTYSGIWSGDSGGPVFVKMPAPDNTWRLIGIISSGLGSSTYAEAVPPYLHWIESSSGIDITPNHYYINGQWLVDYPTAFLPKYEHNPISWGNWYFGCGGLPMGYSDTYTESSNVECSYNSVGGLKIEKPPLYQYLSTGLSFTTATKSQPRTNGEMLTYATTSPPISDPLPFLPVVVSFEQSEPALVEKLRAILVRKQ
ncbi:MAG: S1 family peptidase [Pseudomonadales bacterium]|nr:S1 family peptidase [Pseudomonadales bacterium]